MMLAMHGELEGRYRRLLAAYPDTYRREYEEEMVGVLMAAAEPGSRRPSLRDRADLLAGAVKVRLRNRPGPGGLLRDNDWRGALRAIQIVGTLALLAVPLRRLGLAYSYPGWDRATFEPLWFLHLVWLVAAVAAIAGRRRVAAGAALAGAAVEIAAVGSRYPDSPSQMLLSAWLVVAALRVGAASVALVPGEPVLRPRGLGFFGGGLALFAVADILDHRTGDGYFVGQLSYGVTVDGDFLFRWAVPVFLAAAGLMVIGWWRQGGPVRRRTAVLITPVIAMAVLVSYGFAGFMYSSMQFDSPIYLRGFQWAILALTPLLGFAVSVAALNSYERVSHLVRLGREAERAR